MQRESMNNLSQKKRDIVQVWFERISVRVMSNSTGSVKLYMEVIEELIVERKKFKKLRMKKRKRARKFENQCCKILSGS